MGRWKDNGSGQMYWDANDTGPDQGAPPPLSQGGGGGDPYQSGARPGYHYEWSGGVTGGKHEVPDNPSDPRTPPLKMSDILQGPGMGGGGLSQLNMMAGQPEGPKFPGDSTLPGYGDWNTSNPWRDSLSYEQIMSGAGHQPGSVFGAGAQTGPPPLTARQKHWASNPVYGYTPPSGKPMNWEGVPVGGGLGSLTKSAGTTIGADPSRRWY